MVKKLIVGTSLLFAASVALANQPLSLGEHYVLRSYTGQAMGVVLTDLIKANRVAILTNQSSICAGLTGAIGAQIVAKGAHPTPLHVAALANAEEAARAYASAKEHDAIALIFGGQISPEENYAMVKASLKELAANAYPGALFLHLRVWGAKMVQRAAAEDPQIAQYLANKKNIFTVTVDPAQGDAIVHRVAIDANNQRSVEVLHKMKMNETWLNLFKRSI